MSDLHDAIAVIRSWRDIAMVMVTELEEPKGILSDDPQGIGRLNAELLRLEEIAGTPPPEPWRYDPDWRYFVLSPPPGATDGVEIIVTEESIQGRLFFTKMTITELTAAYSHPTPGAYTTGAQPPERVS